MPESGRAVTGRSRVATAVWMTLALAACSTVRPPAAENLRPVLPTARVYYDDGPAFRDSVRMVVRDINQWQSVWARATSTQASAPPIPTIDFGREMIVLVGAGKMSPGDQIRVDSAGVRRGYFVAVVRTIVECRPFPAEVYPLEIVRVARSERPPTFIEVRERAAHCT